MTYNKKLFFDIQCGFGVRKSAVFDNLLIKKYLFNHLFYPVYTLFDLFKYCKDAKQIYTQSVFIASTDNYFINDLKLLFDDQLKIYDYYLCFHSGYSCINKIYYDIYKYADHIKNPLPLMTISSGEIFVFDNLNRLRKQYDRFLLK